METRQPRVAVELPVTPDAGKREVILRFRSRAEVREHVAACVALMYLLPDDGLDEAGNLSVEIVPWTLGGEGKPGADRCRECARTAAERKADTEMTPVSYLPLSSERLHGARIGTTS